jgi:hypothetical protein
MKEFSLPLVHFTRGYLSQLLHFTEGSLNTSCNEILAFQGSEGDYVGFLGFHVM